MQFRLPCVWGEGNKIRNLYVEKLFIIIFYSGLHDFDQFQDYCGLMD